ncbi:MAG: hypothetical protein AB7V13_10405 [Pseudorhodoplanes sp.]|uniref:hypothetical protein n=1 Tax=Pseudorhodoplanes sp. TaxID=1934341 RepID=UPI003D0CA0F8
MAESFLPASIETVVAFSTDRHYGILQVRPGASIDPPRPAFLAVDASLRKWCHQTMPGPV